MNRGASLLRRNLYWLEAFVALRIASFLWRSKSLVLIYNSVIPHRFNCRLVLARLGSDLKKFSYVGSRCEWLREQCYEENYAIDKLRKFCELAAADASLPSAREKISWVYSKIIVDNCFSLFGVPILLYLSVLKLLTRQICTALPTMDQSMVDRNLQVCLLDLWAQIVCHEEKINKDDGSVFKRICWNSSFVDLAATSVQVNSCETDMLYRTRLSALAQGSGLSVIDVINKVRDEVALSGLDVSYYLFGPGVQEIKTKRRRSLLGFQCHVRTAKLLNPIFLFLGFTFSLAFFIAFFNFVLPEASFLLAAASMIYLICLAPAIMDALAFYSLKKRPSFHVKKQAVKRIKVAVVIPLLLCDREQVLKAAETLRRNSLIKSEADINFVVITDYPDSKIAVDDDSLFFLLKDMVSEIKDVTRFKISILHREKVFVKSQDLFMGWERKRGKIHAFNRFVLGGASSFSRSLGDVVDLNLVEFAYVLDEDNEIYDSTVDSALSYMLHPFNTPTVVRGELLSGYGFVASNTFTTIESTKQWRAKDFFCGSFMPSSRDYLYDLWGTRQCSGKGLYRIETYEELLRSKIPNGIALSHDTLEGAYLRPGFTPKSIVGERFPDNYNKFNKRTVRWLRGDFQNFFLVLIRKVPRNAAAQEFFHWYLARLLIRRCFLLIYPILIFLAFIELGDNSIGFLYFIYVCIYLIPSLIFSIGLRGEWLMPVFKQHIYEFTRMIISIRQAAAVALAAILVALRLIRRRNLLEWNTASGNHVNRLDYVFFINGLACSSLILIGLVSFICNGQWAGIFLVTWGLAGVLSDFIFNWPASHD